MVGSTPAIVPLFFLFAFLPFYLFCPSDRPTPSATLPHRADYAVGLGWTNVKSYADIEMSDLHNDQPASKRAKLALTSSSVFETVVSLDDDTFFLRFILHPPCTRCTLMLPRGRDKER